MCSHFLFKPMLLCLLVIFLLGTLPAEAAFGGTFKSPFRATTITALAPQPSGDASSTSDGDSASALRSVTFVNLSKDQEPQLLCDFLMELGACSASIVDADRDTPSEQAIYMEPSIDEDINGDSTFPAAAAAILTDAAVGRNVWERCNVTAHFAASTDLSFVGNMVREALDLQLDFSSVETVPDRDWVIHVQQSWKPIVVGTKLVLRFPWHTDEDVREVLGVENENQKHVVELQLQGGVAFGTGEHPTTKLCLEWIQRLIQQDESIVNFMDYGCGSGVLGLAACALNDNIMAVGVDIDADAVWIANANAETNALSMFNFLPPLTANSDGESKSVLMKAHQKKGVEVLPEKSNAPIYDALVANILAGPLVTLAPTLASLIRPTGLLGLSGILAPQSNMIIEAYSEYFDNVKVEEEQEGWVLITGVRKQ
jgi:ribosomal protein L11 methyltransferase